MILRPDAWKELLGMFALMALLLVPYGVLMRAGTRAWLSQLVLGALAGGAAIVAIHKPIDLADGVVVDLRNVPLALAGAFFGWRGTATALAMTVATRIGIGGISTVAGCVTMLTTGLAALLWVGLVRGSPRRGPLALAGLAMLTTAGMLGVLLLPAPMVWPFVIGTWPFLVPLHVVAVVGVGSLLERERRLVAEGQVMSRAAERDPLTGLLNRRGFDAMVARVPRTGRGAALLLVDLDHFKRVNDTYGHAAGDAVLRALGPRLRRSLRLKDVVGRFGGEEIIVFLPEVTPRMAEDAGERLCHVIRSEPFALTGEAVLPLTVSVGCAWTGGSPDLDALVARADAALYAAKDAGRNRCCIAAEPRRDASSRLPAPEMRDVRPASPFGRDLSA